MARYTGPRFPLEPLAKLLDAEHRIADDGQNNAVEYLALRLRINRQQIFRARRAGLTIAQADRWAVAAGYHPAVVWPEWAEAV
jgi:hypothetical protein